MKPYTCYQRQSSERSTHSGLGDDDGGVRESYSDTFSSLSPPRTVSSPALVYYNDGLHTDSGPLSISPTSHVAYTCYFDPIRATASDDCQDCRAILIRNQDDYSRLQSPPRIVIDPALPTSNDDDLPLSAGGSDTAPISMAIGTVNDIASAVPPRKTRSSCNRSLRSTRSVKIKVSTQLSRWSTNLDKFLVSAQDQLVDGLGAVHLTTYPNGVTVSNKQYSIKTSKSRSSRAPIMSTHRFIMPITVSEAPNHDWPSVAKGDPSQSELTTMYGCYFISCVRWQNQLWITK